MWVLVVFDILNRVKAHTVTAGGHDEKVTLWMPGYSTRKFVADQNRKKNISYDPNISLPW
jgi:hypothetical protein